MTAFGSILTAGYRADGMRAWKQNSSGTTYYFYDGDTLIMETDATGAKTAVNTNGPSGLLARTDATRTLLFAFDALGQLSQQVLAGAGTVAATYLFDAWGTRSFSSTDTAATSDPYSGFGSSSSYISDWETGLQLLGHRYYDPTIGRFLNRDPIGMAGGVNVYAYCSNSPLAENDSIGMAPWDFFKDWEAAFAACGIGVVLTIIRELAISGFGSPNLWNSLCRIGGACLAAILTAIITSSPQVQALGPILKGCVSGAISGAIGQLINAACDYIFCHKEPDWPCMIVGLIASTIIGCLKGWVNKTQDIEAIMQQIINVIGSAIGSDVKDWCKYKLPPFG